MTDRARARSRLATGRTAAAVLAVAGALAAGPAPGRAQADPAPDTTYPLVVPVRQVAGANVYLDAGTDHGLRRGDTLAVVPAGATEPSARLAVVAVSTGRSVLEQVGDPVEYRSGALITLRLPRRPPPAAAALVEGGAGEPASRAAERSDGAGPDGRGATARPSPSRNRAAPSGSVTMDLSARHSVTGAAAGGDPVDRTYATPGLRLSATAPDVLGGFRLRSDLRLSYRYSDRDLAGTDFAARVSTLSLQRRFEGTPLELELGRFRGPGGLFGGYWDGVRVRLGGPDLGVGAMAGFQPDLWNAAPSADVPKASVYVDWRRGAGASYWRGDVSVHATRPAVDGMADHLFVGLDQTVRLGPLRLDQELQLDREPGGGLSLGRLRLLGVLSLDRDVRLRVGGIRTRRWSLRPVDDPLGPRHDRLSLGLSARPAGARLSLDASLSRREGGADTRGVTGRLSLPAAAALGGAVAGGSVSWWNGDDANTLLVAPDLSLRTPLRARLGYRYYRSMLADRTTTSHTADVRLDLPLADRLRASVGLGIRWGDGLRSDRLSILLHRRF